jgi:hypothetical protein
MFLECVLAPDWVLTGSAQPATVLKDGPIPGVEAVPRHCADGGDASAGGIGMDAQKGRCFFEAPSWASNDRGLDCRSHHSWLLHNRRHR